MARAQGRLKVNAGSYDGETRARGMIGRQARSTYKSRAAAAEGQVLYRLPVPGRAHAEGERRRIEDESEEYGCVQRHI